MKRPPAGSTSGNPRAEGVRKATINFYIPFAAWWLVAAWLLGVPLGTLGIVALILLSSLDHVFLMRGMVAATIRGIDQP